MSRFVVNRNNFGLDELKDSVGANIAVTFCFQAVRQQSEKETDGDNGKKSEREKLENLFRTDDEITDDEIETDTKDPFKED